MGRECMSCDSSFCNNRGSCTFDTHGNQVCTCAGFYYGYVYILLRKFAIVCKI